MARGTALITGCGSGFGRNLVTAMLADGWHVIATLRGAEQRASLFEAEMRASGGRLTLLTIDVTSEADRQGAVALVARDFGGKLDCLVNNAGYGLFGAAEDLDEAQIRAQMETNFFGLVFLTRGLLPALRKGSGRIINVSSVMGFTGMPLSSLYCASKYAVEGFSECLAYELQPHGVQVSIVEPGGFRTRFGESLQLGTDSRNASSPYLTQSRGYERLRRQMNEKRGSSPDVVVRTVAKLALKNRMPLRVRVGRDAGMVYLMKRLLPEKLFHHFLSSLFGKLFSAKGAANAV